ncbi:DeoR family transcriptional regulator [Serratia ureilytica]
MTLITQENEHDRLATRLSIILSRLFRGEKPHIGTLAEEFGVTTRTLRRDFNVRLTHLDIEQSNGVYPACLTLLSSPHGTGYEDTGEVAAS